MPIPNFQVLLLPMLRYLSDGKDRTNAEIEMTLAGEFKLSDNDRRELLPSGQARFLNRIGWAKSHLVHAGLLESPRHAAVRITDRGRQVLSQSPGRIDLSFLDQFPEHLSFRTSSRKRSLPNSPPQAVDQITPEEHMAHGYQQIREELASELLRRVKEASPAFFERLVIELLVAMGYGGSLEEAGTVIGKSGDGGIDGIIKEDKLGLDTIYVQAKRWANVVGRPEIQKFAGALQGQRARKGIFITTSSFTKEAEDFASSIETRIVLIDGDDLSDYMIDHGVGVTSIQTYTVKRLDSDFFVEE